MFLPFLALRIIRTYNHTLNAWLDQYYCSVAHSYVKEVAAQGYPPDQMYNKTVELIHKRLPPIDAVRFINDYIVGYHCNHKILDVYKYTNSDHNISCRVCKELLMKIQKVGFSYVNETQKIGDNLESSLQKQIQEVIQNALNELPQKCYMLPFCNKEHYNAVQKISEYLDDRDDINISKDNLKKLIKP